MPHLELWDLAFNELVDFQFDTLEQVGTLSNFRLNISHNRLTKLAQNNITSDWKGDQGKANSEII